MTPFLGNLLSGVTDIGSSIVANFMNEYFYRLRNRHLTGKEVEQNVFNAQQAQKNRDFEERMSNTANQRAVEDMQNAGLNPALMYGNGSAASTPTGSNAQGSASVSNGPDMGSMIAAMTQMRLANAEIKVKESEANLNNKNATKVDTEIESLKTNIEGSRLDNEQKQVVLKYLDQQKQLEISNAQQDIETKEANQRKIGAEINKMSVEKLKIFADYLEALENINVLKSQTKLNEAQAYEAYHMVKQIDANARYLGIQAENYDLTQGVKIKLDVGFGPFKAGSEQYLTLPQLREYLKVKQESEENKGKGKENNAGLDYQDYRVD